MSRGPGRVQKLIKGLIASDPHGAWSVTQLCKHIYPDAAIDKKHRVAVTHALRKMVLPATWDVHTLSRQGNEYCLHDRCDLESTLGLTYLGWWRDAPIDFATWKGRFPHHIEIAENKVSDACRYRDALPLGKIKIERTARTATTTAAMNHASGRLTHMGEASIQLPKIDATAAWNDRRCRWITLVRSPSRSRWPKVDDHPLCAREG